MSARKNNTAASNEQAAGSGPKIAVVLADDHAVVREGLVAIIDRQEDMTVVGEAATGKEVVDLWRALQPDVTLVDLRMPGMDGVAAINAIRAIEPKARIVILTTYDGDVLPRILT